MTKVVMLGAFRLHSSLKRKLSRHWVRESQLDTEAIAQRNAEPSTLISLDQDFHRRNAELFREYEKTRSTKTRDEIARLNQKLCMLIAIRHSYRTPIELDDLIQLANVGLLKAIERYQLDSGYRFSTFAVPWMVGEIKHFCRDHDTTVKIPRRWREQADSVRKAQKDLLEQGREVSTLAVALSMGFSAERWREIEQATSNYKVISLDDEEAQQLAADDVENTEIEDAIAYGLGSLPDQQRTCIVERFWGQLSDNLIAARHGLTASEVSQLINDGIIQLRTV